MLLATGSPVSAATSAAMLLADARPSRKPSPRSFSAAVIGATIDFKVKPETKLRVDFTQNWGGGASNLMRDRNFMSFSLTTSF